MNCKFCNAPLSDGAAFCTNCGAKVEPEQSAPVAAPAPQQPEQAQMPIQPQAPQEPQQPMAAGVYQQPVQPEPQPQQPAYQQMPVQQAPPQQPAYQQMPQQQMPPQQPAYQQMPPQQPAYQQPVQGQYQSVMSQAAPPKKSKGKIIGIIIAAVVVLLVIVIAVSGKSDKEKLVGVWSTTIDFSEYMEDNLINDEDFSFINEYVDDANYSMVFEYEFIFNEDDTCTAYITQDSYDAFMDNYVEIFRQTYINYSRTEYSDQTADMTDEEILELLDFDELEAELREDPDVQIDTLNDFADFATFSVEDGVITFYDAEVNGGFYYEADYTLNGDILTLSFREIEDEALTDYFQNIVLIKLDSVG